MDPLLACAMPPPPQLTPLQDVLGAVQLLRGDLAGMLQPAQKALSTIPIQASQGTGWESSSFPVQRVHSPTPLDGQLWQPVVTILFTHKGQ